MRTTTVGALDAAFTERIRQIVPSATEHQTSRWRPVDDRDNVANGEIRTFYVDISGSRPAYDGIYGTGIEREATVLVYASYGNIKRKLKQHLAASDGHDIWLDLEVRRDATTDNTIAGLVSLEHQGWQDEDDEQGRHWGAHVYALRYLADGIP
jgi:hypothetical protein